MSPSQITFWIITGVFLPLGLYLIFSRSDRDWIWGPTLTVIGIVALIFAVRGLLREEPHPTSVASMLPRRHLTVAQTDLLINSLSRITFVHSVRISAPNTDQDAWDYAADFVYVFRKAGWTIVDDGIHPTTEIGSGISILFRHDDWNTSFANELDATFARAQIEIHGRGVNPALPNGQIEFAVGYAD